MSRLLLTKRDIFTQMYTELSHYVLILTIFFVLTLKHTVRSRVISILFLVLSLCFCGTLACYMCSDFSIYNIFTNSNINTPLFYKISATWSNHEGSFLLWCWLLSLYGFIFCYLAEQSIMVLTHRRCASDHFMSFFRPDITNRKKPVVQTRAKSLRRGIPKDLSTIRPLVSFSRPEVRRCAPEGILLKEDRPAPSLRSAQRRSFVRTALEDQQTHEKDHKMGFTPFRNVPLGPMVLPQKGSLGTHSSTTTESRFVPQPPNGPKERNSSDLRSSFRTMKCMVTNGNSNVYMYQRRAAAMYFDPQWHVNSLLCSERHNLNSRWSPTLYNNVLDITASYLGKKIKRKEALWATSMALWEQPRLWILLRLNQNVKWTQIQQRINSFLIYMYIICVFTLFLILTSNPFLRMPFTCLNSVVELNPVLQDPVLAVHPPCIYAGYVASAVGFSLCLSKLWQISTEYRNTIPASTPNPRRNEILRTFGAKSLRTASFRTPVACSPSARSSALSPHCSDLRSLFLWESTVRSSQGRSVERQWRDSFLMSLGSDAKRRCAATAGFVPQPSGTKQYAAQIRTWSLIGWCFLTVGILLGSWWAYHELGWGGWWFWDPVENASLMPWLCATAAIHSVISPKLSIVTLGLNLLTFVLSLLGTFFVRSGLLASVHSFAVDSTRGLFLISFVLGVTVISVFLLVQFYKALNSFPGLASPLLFGKEANAKKPNVPSQGRSDQRLLDHRRAQREPNVNAQPPGASRWSPHSSDLVFLRDRSFREELKQFCFTPKGTFLLDKRKRLEWTQTEQILLLQALCLILICAVVLCGTSAPVLFQWLFNRDVSTGGLFFNRTIVPLFGGVLAMLVYMHYTQLKFKTKTAPLSKLANHKKHRRAATTQLQPLFVEQIARFFYLSNLIPWERPTGARLTSARSEVRRISFLSTPGASYLSLFRPQRYIVNVKHLLACIWLLCFFHFIGLIWLSDLSLLETFYAVTCMCLFGCLMLASKSKRAAHLRINHTILHQNTPPIPSRLIAFTNYWNKMAFNMKLSHAGLALFLIGVLLSNTYKIQLTQILRFGSQISLGTQICCLRGIDQNYGPTFHSICGNLVVYQQASTQTRAPNTVGERLLSFFGGKDAYRRGGQEARLSHWYSSSINDGVFYHRHEVPKGTMDITRHWEFTQSLFRGRVLCLFPEKRFFFSNSELSTTKVAIHTNLFTDLYCLIGAGSAETGWYTTIMRLPFIFCIWIGFLLAAIGGISSLSYQVQKVKLKWI